MNFNKILVAKNSPKNKCYAEEGEWLIIAQEEHHMKGGLPKEHHFFIGANSQKPSRYGWVSSIEFEINAEEYGKKYNENPSKDLIASCLLLLKSIKNQKEDTPMACTFSTIGILEKKKELKVHKVFFYRGENRDIHK